MGVPPKGCLGSPPRSAYRSEDRAEAQSHHSCSLMVERAHRFLQLLLFLQRGVNPNSPAFPDELTRGPEPVPQTAQVIQLCQ